MQRRPEQSRYHQANSFLDSNDLTFGLLSDVNRTNSEYQYVFSKDKPGAEPVMA